MGMKHSVKDIDQLYSDAKNMLDNVVTGTADEVLSKLKSGIENLKNTWKGQDAGVNINNLVTVYNDLVGIRNDLGKLAVASAGVAKLYKDIQISNGASASSYQSLSVGDKSKLDAYSDSSAGADIVPEAENGKQNVDAAKDRFMNFVNESKSSYNKIMENWTEGGEERASAVQAFELFLKAAEGYINTMSSVSTKIANALENYNF